MLFFFFFNDTATTEIYTLSLHDALPICAAQGSERLPSVGGFPRDHAGGEDHVRVLGVDLHLGEVVCALRDALVRARSEEHTSELQSQSNLVCRLLLEKKKLHSPLTISSF